MSFLPHVLGLFRLRWFEAFLRFAPQPLAGPDRSDLARRARVEIAAGLSSGLRPVETS
jgi:hypothetical protein